MRKRFGFASIVSAIIWCALAIGPAMGVCQDLSTAPSAGQSQSGGNLTLRRFPIVLGQNLTSNLFARQNLLPFLIGSASALAIAPADQEISRSMYGHSPEFGNAGDKVGPIVSTSIAGGAFVVSRLTKNEHFRAFGYAIGQAYLANGLLTEGLKFATQRMRPDQSDSKSFPSGHTSSAFTVATVINNYYGKKWGIPLYAFAGLVGISRIEKGQHWPSDVIAGAALGYIVGQTATRGTKREQSRKTVLSGLTVAPVYARDMRGISVRLLY